MHEPPPPARHPQVVATSHSQWSVPRCTDSASIRLVFFFLIVGTSQVRSTNIILVTALTPSPSIDPLDLPARHTVVALGMKYGVIARAP